MGILKVPETTATSSVDVDLDINNSIMTRNISPLTTMPKIKSTISTSIVPAIIPNINRRRRNRPQHQQQSIEAVTPSPSSFSTIKNDIIPSNNNNKNDIMNIMNDFDNDVTTVPLSKKSIPIRQRQRPRQRQFQPEQKQYEQNQNLNEKSIMEQKELSFDSIPTTIPPTKMESKIKSSQIIPQVTQTQTQTQTVPQIQETQIQDRYCPVLSYDSDNDNDNDTNNNNNNNNN